MNESLSNIFLNYTVNNIGYNIEFLWCNGKQETIQSTIVELEYTKYKLRKTVSTDYPTTFRDQQLVSEIL